MKFMTPEMSAKLKRSLVLHEGRANHPYVCTAGKITIGIGYNLTDRGLPDEWIDKQYLDDVDYFYSQLSTIFTWFPKLNQDRQIVLVDMCFMGFKKFCEFVDMIAALENHDYERGANEMLDSAWAKEVGVRAAVLATAMRKGIYEI
jgi:lysozyme